MPREAGAAAPGVSKRRRINRRSVWRPRALALNPKGIGVPDEALSPYRLAHWAERARAFTPYIEMGFTDDEAWHALFDDDLRLKIFKTNYGATQPKKVQVGCDSRVRTIKRR